MHPRLIELREEHGQPSERSANKVKDQLSEQVKEFIQASPFAVLSSSDKEGNCDASPRGGLPGFVKIVNEKQLFIPDIKGNRLFHSFSNFHSNPKAGMVFFIPGSNMTVRVNGRVELIEGSPGTRCAQRHGPASSFHCRYAQLRGNKATR